MAKHTLEIEYDYNFILLAISCHEPDYKLCHALNQSLGIELLRENDLELKNKKQEDQLLFSNYSYVDEAEYLEYILLSNKSYNASRTIANTASNQGDLFGETDESASAQKGFLVPELSNADYLLIVKAEYDPDLAEDLENKVKQISFVLNVQVADAEALPSKKNLIV
jgi:hypothetical protein